MSSVLKQSCLAGDGRYRRGCDVGEGVLWNSRRAGVKLQAKTSAHTHGMRRKRGPLLSFLLFLPLFFVQKKQDNKVKRMNNP